VTTQQGQKAETHLTYAGGRVKGTSAAPQPDGSVKRFEIDTALPPGTVDENAVPFVVPALPLAPGKTFAMTFFTPSEVLCSAPRRGLGVRCLTLKFGPSARLAVRRTSKPSQSSRASGGRWRRS